MYYPDSIGSLDCWNSLTLAGLNIFLPHPDLGALRFDGICGICLHIGIVIALICLSIRLQDKIEVPALKKFVKF